MINKDWAPKNWCFLTVVLEKTLESPLDCKEIQPVHPYGNHSWIFIWRSDAEAETPILWPPDGKNWLIGKYPGAGKDWRQEEKGTTEDEGMASPTLWTWKLDHKGSWTLKNWYFLTVVLEKTLESPLDCKEIKPVNPKGNQPWIFIGRTDAEAEAPILWPPYSKSQLIRKDPDAGEDWRQEKGTTEDEMVGWNHWLDEHEFEQAPGTGDGQGSLACCSPWGLRVKTRLSNWTELNWGHKGSSLVAHSMKNLPAMQETWLGLPRWH